MKARLATSAGVLVLALSTAVRAQEPAPPTDWTLTRNPETSLVAATIEFDNGIGLIARCKDNVYDLMVVGLPPALERTRYRELGLTVGENADETTRNSSWTIGTNPDVAFSRVPALIARFLAKGGKLQIIVPATEDQRRTLFVMPIEPSATALEETLTACGRPLQDPRDDQLEDEDAAGPGAGIRWLRQPRPQFPDPVRGRSPRDGYATLSCRTEADGSLSACQVESEQPAGFNVAQTALESVRRARVGLTPAGRDAGLQLEGRLIIFSVNFRLAS